MDQAGGRPPAGWYRTGDELRYWDGQQWTAYTAPLAAPEPARAPDAGDRAVAWVKTHKLLAATFVVVPLVVLISAMTAAIITMATSTGPTAGPPPSPDISPPAPAPSTAPESTSPPTTPTSPSARTTPNSTRRPQQPPDPITGYGATKSAWLSAHRQAPGYERGVAFLPMVERDGSRSPKYAAVTLYTPVVTYTVNLPEGTDLEEAKRLAMDEFPPGAEFGAFDDDEPRCLLASVRSKPVQAVMHKYGYDGFVPLVAFFTTTATTETLDPDNITDLSLAFTEPGRDLGRC